ncbi:MAG TPA: hypothetical protein VF136_05725 [Methylomirabilota bacterium]
MLAAAFLACAVALTAGDAVFGQARPPANVPGIDKPVVVFSGPIAADTTWTADRYWVLRGAVFVANGATLTIEPGTTIVGELATIGTLVVEQGGRLIADGRADAPIVFTSDQPPGLRNRGDWGGLIINGRAPLNVPGGLAVGEGDTGIYGGTDPGDDSGILRYVRVEFAGIEFSPDNELNGIAFQGVGRGTVVDYVQVRYNKDDGVEFFGGTVDAKHLVLSAIGDDSMDWTDGWTGRVQFVVAHQRGDDADQGIEADNNGDNNDLLPRSAPTIYNLTLIGDPFTNFGNESDDGILVREGTAGTFRNFIVLGFKEYGVNLDQDATVAQAATGALSFRNGIVFGNGLLPNRANLDAAAQPFLGGAQQIRFEDPGLIDPFNHRNPNFRPYGTDALAGGSLMPVAVPPNDGFFEFAPFIGALSPDPELDWTQGWTSYDAP